MPATSEAAASSMSSRTTFAAAAGEVPSQGQQRRTASTQPRARKRPITLPPCRRTTWPTFPADIAAILSIDLIDKTPKGSPAGRHGPRGYIRGGFYAKCDRYGDEV